MKKMFLVAALALLSIGASAQIEEGLRMGMGAGLTLSSIKGTNDYGPAQGKTAVGYGASIIFDYNFTENFHLETSLGLLSKGGNDLWDGALEGNFTGNYLAIPIHLGYRFRLGGNLYVNFQAGPEIDCGLWGKKFEWNDGSGEFKYFDEGWAERFEFGIGGKVGVEFSKLQINFGTTYGLTKWSKDTDYHTLAFMIGIAYIL